MKNIFKALTFIALLFTTTSLFAASDYYLKLEGIDGEGKGKTFKVKYDKNGKGEVKNLPPGNYLMKYCATGTHIKQAKLFVRKQGTDQHDYMQGGEIQIESFSFGASSQRKSSTKGKVNVAAGDVTGDGRADIITSADANSSAGHGGGAGKASFSDLSIMMKTPDGKTAQSQGGGGAGKVSMQDMHIMMKPAPSLGKDMFEGDMGTITIVGPFDSQADVPCCFDTELLEIRNDPPR